MANYFCKSGSGVTEFAKNTAYSVGDRVVPARADTGTNHLIAKRYVWKCTTAGTTDTTNYPTWNASYTTGDTETSGTAVFTCHNPGYSDTSSTTVDWTYATPFLDYGVTRLQANDDVLYVSSSHAETNTMATASVPSFERLRILSVADDVTSSFVLTPGASVTTTSAINFSTYKNSYVYGVYFTSSYSGSGGVNLTCGLGYGVFEKCRAILTSAGQIYWGGSGYSAQNLTRFIDCDVKFASTGSYITVAKSVEVIGGSILSGGTNPNTLFASGTSAAGKLFVSGFDASNAGTGLDLFTPGNNHHEAVFTRMKMPASWAGDLQSTVQGGISSQSTHLHICDNSVNYRTAYQNYSGAVFSDTGVYNDAGASDGTQRFSWRMVTNANANYFVPLFSPDIAVWNSVTSGTVTLTVEVVHNSQGSGTNGVLNDDECWIEVMYFGTTGAPLGSYISDRKANVLATAAAQDTSAASWTGDAAGWDTQKLSVSFDPKVAGYVTARVVLAKASATVYVDPLLTVS